MTNPDIEKLNEYLRSISTKHYKPKEHDCLSFTNSCWEVMYGKPWSVGLETLYSPDAPFELKAKTLGIHSIEDAIGRYLKRASPVVGSLVVMNLPNSKPIGKGLGICLGLRSVFLSHVGTVMLPTRIVESSWKC